MGLELALTSVADANAGTRNARLRQMVDQHFDAVWRALRRLGVPEATADDAAQKVFLVASSRLAEIDPGGEKRYLMGIAWRVASDARQALLRRREVPIGDVDPACLAALAASQPDEVLAQKQALQILAAILDELSQPLRDAFVLFELEELSAMDVALVLDIPVGTVASRVRRAREHVRKSLESRRER